MTRENDNLMFAICENDYDMVKESLENGADPNCENGLPLILAVRGGHVKILKLLRAYNVNFNPKNTIDTDFNPPMVIAASKGNVKMCEFLLKNGANKDAQDFIGRTAMIHASKNGYYDVVKMLVDNGADKNIKDRFGKTALSYAIFEKQKGIAELLKNNDATLERKDVKKQTPPELGK